MSSKGAPLKKTQGFETGAMALMATRNKVEIDSQLRFGANWGVLVGSPATLDDELVLRKKELEEMKEKVFSSTASSIGGSGARRTLSNTQAKEQMNDIMRSPIEKGLKFKSMP